MRTKMFRIKQTVWLFFSFTFLGDFSTTDGGHVLQMRHDLLGTFHGCYRKFVEGISASGVRPRVAIVARQS